MPFDPAVYKKVAMLLHCINTYHYMTIQQGAFDSKNIKFVADWLAQQILTWACGSRELADVVRFIAQNVQEDNKEFGAWINAIRAKLDET